MKTAILAASAATMAAAPAAARFEFKDASGGDPVVALAQAFEQFKATNDAALAEIKAKGSADPVTDEKLTKLNDEISRLSSIVEAVEKKNARPMMGRDGREMTPEAKAHREGFVDFLRKGNEAGLADLQQKALSVGVNADGGFTVPQELDRMIYDMVKEVSPLRAICNVVSVGSNKYEKLVNLHGTASGWVNETAARPETNSPQFASIVPPSGELYANPASTKWMLEDSIFDVEAWLATEIALEFAKAEGAAFISGSGTNRPRGFLAGSAPVATADAARAFGVLQYVAGGAASTLPTSHDVYINMVYALKAMHRTGAAWVTSKAVLSEIRKIKDTTGQYLWQPTVAADQPSTFLGYPVTEAEDMPSVAANAFPLAFGNFRNGYTITERTSTDILRDPFTNKPYVMFYATKRVGGAVIDSDAIKVLKISTT
jgi:HK97 family phage major capsid protein